VEIRVNRIGRSSRHGTGNDVGGGGSPPPGGGSGTGDITNITVADNLALVAAQVNCASAHNLVNGQVVTIAGNSNAPYNTTSAITIVSATKFLLDDVLYDVDGTGGTWTLQ
jgi:hypothetical protein